MLQIPQTINLLGWTIVCISDTHSKLSKIEQFPQADIIIHGGDFSNVGELRDIQKFHQEFGDLPYPIKIFIAGNHDLSSDLTAMNHPNFKRIFTKDAQKLGISFEDYHNQTMSLLHSNACSHGQLKYLQDDSVLVSSSSGDAHASPPSPPLKIYGSPWQPEFFDWAFNLPRGRALAEKWSMIPSSVDILITHGPPHRILDRTNHGEDVGCEELRKLLENGVIKPRIHIFGHIHETYGTERVGDTLYVNASTCTLSYRPTNPPIVVFLPHDKSQPAQVIPFEQWSQT